MNTVALILAVLLAGQVDVAGGRYTQGGDAAAPPGNSSPANSPPAASANNNGAPAGQGGLIPKIEPPPRQNAASGGDSPAATTAPLASPYERPAVPAGGSGSGLSPYDGASPPRANNSVAPPPPRNPSSTQGSAAATTPVGKPPVTTTPSSMMKQVMTPPPASQLSGMPISLMDVVSGAHARQEQAQRVEAYWDLCSSVADYYLGVREQGELIKLRSMLPRGGAMLDRAESEFVVRLGTSKQAAVASQRRLASMIGRGGSSLPLPKDIPHCGSYQTRYDEIFTGRSSIEAQELAALLPLRYTELKDAATAILRAQDRIMTVARNESGDGIETLSALELLALRRRAFVQIARDYNRRIARYAELSTPGEIGPERLVGMLIKVDVPPTATRPSLPARTSGRQSQRSAVPPRTFADEGWEPARQNVSRATSRHDSVVTTSAVIEASELPREERSLLVSPR